MVDRRLPWRAPKCFARRALDYYRGFFSQFSKIRFAVDVSSSCDEFSVELATLSDRFLGLVSSAEEQKVAGNDAKERNLEMDFQIESLAEMLERLKGNNQNCPDLITACNAFANEKEQDEGAKLMTQILRPGGALLLLSVSIINFPNLNDAAFQTFETFLQRVTSRYGPSSTSADPELMLDDQQRFEERVEVSVSRTEFEKGIRNDPGFFKWKMEQPEELEKELSAMLDAVWKFVGPQDSNISLCLSCAGLLARKIIF